MRDEYYQPASASGHGLGPQESFGRRSTVRVNTPSSIAHAASPLIAVAVWLIRSTRVDPPEVAVLELMTTHAYLAADTEERERMIERVLAEIAEAGAAAADRDDVGEDARVDNDVPPNSAAMEATTNSSDGGEPADSVR